MPHRAAVDFLKECLRHGSKVLPRLLIAVVILSASQALLVLATKHLLGFFQQGVHWVPLIWGLIFLGILRTAASYQYNRCQLEFSLRVGEKFRERIFAQVLSLPFARLQKKSVGEWMSIVMGDAALLETRVSDLLTGFLKDGVLLLGALGALLYVSWQATLALFLLLPILGFVLGRWAKRIAYYGEFFQRTLGELAGRVAGYRLAFSVIRSHGGEENELQRFATANRLYLEKMLRSIPLRAAFAPGLEWLGFAVLAALLWFSTQPTRFERLALPPEVLAQTLVALGLMMRPLREMGEQLSRLAEIKGGLTRSFALLSIEPPPLAPLPAARQQLAAKDFFATRIAVGYEEKTICEAQDFRLTAGTATLLVGPSGAGKSTLLYSLAGLVAPQTWNANISWQELSTSTAFVGQRPFFFRGTLRENLTYGLPQRTDAEITAVLAQMELDTWLKSRAAGLNEPIGGYLKGMSGGQLQRLALARALLQGAPFLLLDEITSGLDVATEKQILQVLLQYIHQHSVAMLLVTHREVGDLKFDQILHCTAGEVHGR